MILTDIPVLDRVLAEHRAVLGADFAGYCNHTYRVANLCIALARPTDRGVETIALAAAFHDIGIWTARSFDYLPPSLAAAQTHLGGAGRAPEIEAMILEHHKLLPYRNHPEWLVEPFRKADFVDVAGGVVRFGLERNFVRALFGQWPSAGFHKRLVQLAARRLATHPRSPLPMLKL